MSEEPIEWLLTCDEPWTRYRTMVTLLHKEEEEVEVQRARAEMLRHPKVVGLVQAASQWPGEALRRHNDASHPLYALSTLADFGVSARDRGMAGTVKRILTRQSPEGAIQSLLNISKAFGGTGADQRAWVACDAPTLLYVLLAMGDKDDSRVGKAVNHLLGLVEENGWRCHCAPELGRFRGPGRKGDPCPIANVYALKALSLVPGQQRSPAARHGADALLSHWERRRETRPYLFGIGTDFRKLKYPFIWYDILHVTEVLSRFTWVHKDRRFREMVDAIEAQADDDGRFVPGSKYLAWKDWSFADKKRPSPWLTFLVLRIRERLRATNGKRSPAHRIRAGRKSTNGHVGRRTGH